MRNDIEVREQLCAAIAEVEAIARSFQSKGSEITTTYIAAEAHRWRESYLDSIRFMRRKEAPNGQA